MVDIEERNIQYNVTLEEIKGWREKGPLGKLHNFVVYVQRSVQRSVQREQHF